MPDYSRIGTIAVAQIFDGIVIGGGAAGFFAAINAAELGCRMLILEGSSQVLAKVRVSGGGRCNVTHACFEPRELVARYPRGGRELLGPLTKFHPGHTVDWFGERGVPLKTESDGRMFPTTDDSATIVDCFLRSAQQEGVEIRTRSPVREIVQSDLPDRANSNGLELPPSSHALSDERPPYLIRLADDSVVVARKVILATGGSRGGLELARSLGHQIVPPVPSLFTFQIQDERLTGLAGTSVGHVELKLTTESGSLEQSGPLLITHWGMSGPAILKLSAWGARWLHTAGYRATLRVNWLPGLDVPQLLSQLRTLKGSLSKKSVTSQSMGDLSKRLWRGLVLPVIGDETKRWAELTKVELQRLAEGLIASNFSIAGKGVFKEEFVTCGGISLAEVDFRTMESRLVPGLYFAGEILDIDGITGGFNFQNAWTTAWIAAKNIP